MSASAFELVKTVLGAYPHVPLTESEDELTVPAADENGFDVNIVEEEAQYIVFYEGWHGHVKKTDAERAATAFMIGLTDTVRMAVRSRGGEDCSLTIEENTGAEWRFCGTVKTLIALKFWKSAPTRYLQNHWIPRAGGDEEDN